MVPLIISHDGAVHKDSVRRWKNFAPDVQVDWVRMAQNVLPSMWSLSRDPSTKEAGSLRLGEKSTPKNLQTILDPQSELLRQKSDWND